MSLSWKDWLMPKQNDSIMLSPNKDRTLTETIRANILANTQPGKSAETQNNMAKPQPKTTISTATSQKQEEKVNMFKQAEPARTSTPRFGNTFDLQDTRKERMQKYGMDLLSRNKSTVQPPMTRKISALDPDEEEFTPAGENAFLEGFNEGYEDRTDP